MNDTVKVVVEMPKETYLEIRSGFITRNAIEAAEVIKNGTLLPKECDIQRIIPKRVNVQKWIDTRCPNSNCDYKLSKHHGDGYYSIEHKPDFCPVCGQALLWESEVAE